MAEAPLQQMQQQQQRQQLQLWPAPLPFPVKSGFLKAARGKTAATTTGPTPSKPRCRKVATRCRIAGCSGRPWFALPGSRVPKACKDHKEEGEVNIYTRVCEVDGCGTRPHYGMEGARARFCCTHKLDGMVDVLNKRCATEGCRKQPSWAISKGTRALFCKEHKEGGMVDTKHRTCLHPGCTRFPSKSAAVPATTPFSVPSTPPVAESTAADSQALEKGAVMGEGDASPLSASGSGSPAAAPATTPTAEAPGPARYCAAHAPTGAVNVAASRCRHPGGCSVQPYFGREGGGQQAEFCARHRKRGMTDVRNPRCGAMGCTAQPCCGKKGDPRPLLCLRHAEPGMINFRSEGYRGSARQKRSKVLESPACKR
ncbi:unnamed protein product [Pylaiella littoralis]